MIVWVNIPSANELTSRLRIDPNGLTQRWHTQNILRHMIKFMPMVSGAFTKQAVIASTTKIQITAPQAYYLYYGKRMVNSKTGKGPRYIPGVGYRWPRGATLVPTNDPLNYTKTFHPLAGPFWDERMVAAEGDQIAAELQAFVNLRGTP